MQGEVKFYNPVGKYGFVLLTDGDLIHAEFFFHADCVQGPLPHKGDACEFLVDDPRGGVGNLVAVQLRRLGYSD